MNSESLDQLLARLRNGNGKVPTVPQPAPVPVLYQPSTDINCYCPCDFRNLPVQPGTVQAVITDIPYVREWLPHVSDFAEWCSRVLVPGGVMATFYGQHHLDECMVALSQHLQYQWIFISPLTGVNGNYAHPVSSRYQLALVYTNSKAWKLRRVTEDVIPSTRRRDRDTTHPHRKNVPQMQFLVEAFSQEGNLIVDPCAGGFTTAVACHNTHRRFIGCDKNPDCLRMAKERFGSVTKEVP
jgi:hypothetical protein